MVWEITERLCIVHSPSGDSAVVLYNVQEVGWEVDSLLYEGVRLSFLMLCNTKKIHLRHHVLTKSRRL